MSMSLVDSLKVLHAVRTDEVVLTTMGSAREWMKLGTHPLDFIYAPSAMGEAPALALGIALAQPQRKVIACNGDGCMLMNLGTLVTLAAERPPNLVLIVFDNGVYEVTGQQRTPASLGAAQGQPIDFAALARACGFTSVFDFQNLVDWQANLRTVLADTGSTFVVLKVDPVPGGDVPKSPAPAMQRARDFAVQLQRG
jgi:thiamine pyrophosphate-dependent acetolactate synthase large subunit-like protein